MRISAQAIAVIIMSTFSAGAFATESFAFWPQKGAKRAPGFQSIQEHPCGEVAYARVSKLPAIGRGPLLPEVVVELNQTGKVVRRWPIPVDYMPEAIRGEELLVAFGEKKFWVRPNGTFTKTSVAAKTSPKESACDLKPVFGDSGYAACSTFVDQASLKERILGYQGACT